MMANMKSGQPFIRIRAAYPRVSRAHGGADLSAPRPVIAVGTFVIAAFIYLGRLLLHINFRPVREIGILFFAIFPTMTPVLILVWLLFFR